MQSSITCQLLSLKVGMKKELLRMETEMALELHEIIVRMLSLLSSCEGPCFRGRQRQFEEGGNPLALPESLSAVQVRVGWYYDADN